MISWWNKSYDERVEKIEAIYSKEQEENDLQVLSYLKDNHEEYYYELEDCYWIQYPESWEGNFIKIFKLDDHAGAEYNLFQWFCKDIPIL